MIRTNEFSFTACSGTNLKHLCNAKFIHTTNSSFPLWPLHCSIHGAKLCHLCTNSSRWLPCSLTLLLVPPVTMVQETPQLSLHRTTPWTHWGTRLGFSYSFTPKLHETALLILRGTLLEEKKWEVAASVAKQHNRSVQCKREPTHIIQCSPEQELWKTWVHESYLVFSKANCPP